MKSNFVPFNFAFLKLKSLSKPRVALTLPFGSQALPDCQAPPPAASVPTKLIPGFSVVFLPKVTDMV